MEEGLNKIKNEGCILPAEQYSPLTLAFIGDAVFEVFVRRRIVMAFNMPVNKLNSRSTALVKAQAQSRMIRRLKEELTETEYSVYKRGRNAKSNTSAKNASIKDYRRATGFEALIGYLYLDGQTQRLTELMERAVSEEERYLKEIRRQADNEKKK